MSVTTDSELAKAVDAERARCVEIALSLAYGDNEDVKAVCEQIAKAIDWGATVQPTMPRVRDALLASTVSAIGKVITVECDSRESADAIMTLLEDKSA